MNNLNHTQIHELLFSEERAFRNIGVQNVLLGLPDTIPLAIDFLAHSQDEYFVSALEENLRRNLPFLRFTYPPVPDMIQNRYRLFPELYSSMTRFLDEINKIMPDLSIPLREKMVERLSQFPGIANKVSEMIFKTWGADLHSQFETFGQQLQQKVVKRQLMIFLLYRCNLNCVYCFAGDQASTDMPFRKVTEIMDWALDNQVKIITFCGGEPTIHPDFARILDELRERELRTYFATNLLYNPDVLEKLRPDIVDCLIVHVAHRNIYRNNQWEQFAKNVANVLEQGVRIAFRINIYATDHNWDYLFDLAKKTGVNEIQVALTFPNSTHNNRFVNSNRFQELIPAVCDLMQRCDTEGLRIVFSKPIPPCLFPEPLQHKILTQLEFSPSCSVYMDDCSYNACVTPDGHLAPCLSLLDESQPVEHFGNWDKVSEYCRTKVTPLINEPLFEQCHECFLFAWHICQGACLGHKKYDNGCACSC